MSDMTTRDDPHGIPSALERDYVLRVYPLDRTDEVRLVDLWRIVFARRWLIIGITVLMGAIATIVAFVMTPVYRSFTQVAVITGDQGPGALGALGQLSGLAALAGINISGGNTSAQSLATLKSRVFTDAFIRKHGLMPILFEPLWDPVRKAWNVSDPDDVPTAWKAYDRFDSLRQIDEDAQTGLVTVTVDWSDAQLAAQWANELIDEVNETLRQRAVLESKRNLAFLESQLASNSEVGVRTALFGLIETEMKNAMFANARKDYAFKVIEPAYPAEKRYRPNRILMMLLGLTFGLVVGVVIAVIRGPVRQERP